MQVIDDVEELVELGSGRLLLLLLAESGEWGELFLAVEDDSASGVGSPMST